MKLTIEEEDRRGLSFTGKKSFPKISLFKNMTVANSFLYIINASPSLRKSHRINYSNSTCYYYTRIQNKC